MEKKIKIVVFGMVVALLVTFLPFRQTEIYAGISENAYSYYQEYGNNVCFFPFSETDGMIYYATKANLASSDIRYRTIGWKLSVKDSSGKKLQTMYFKLGGNYMYAVHCVRKGGAEYNLYALTLGDLKDRLNAKASQALNKGKASMVMDACMIVVRKGNAVLQVAVQFYCRMEPAVGRCGKLEQRVIHFLSQLFPQRNSGIVFLGGCDCRRRDCIGFRWWRVLLWIHGMFKSKSKERI